MGVPLVAYTHHDAIDVEFSFCHGEVVTEADDFNGRPIHQGTSVPVEVYLNQQTHVLLLAHLLHIDSCHLRVPRLVPLVQIIFTGFQCH